MANYLGNFIRQKRGNKSLREFADIIGISHSHLDSIEKGYDPKTGKPVNLSLDVLNKLSQVLNVDDLLLIYLAKTENKEATSFFDTLIEFQKKYKEFYEKYYDIDEHRLNFKDEKLSNEWKEEKDKCEKELHEIGENDFLLLLKDNCSTDEILSMIQAKSDLDKLSFENFKKIINQLYQNSEKNNSKSTIQSNVEKASEIMINDEELNQKLKEMAQDEFDRTLFKKYGNLTEDKKKIVMSVINGIIEDADKEN